MRMLVLNGNYRAPLIFNEETQDAAEKSSNASNPPSACFRVRKGTRR
jgi:hypothetical protein